MLNSERVMSFPSFSRENVLQIITHIGTNLFFDRLIK